MTGSRIYKKLVNMAWQYWMLLGLIAINTFSTVSEAGAHSSGWLFNQMFWMSAVVWLIISGQRDAPESVMVQKLVKEYEAPGEISFSGGLAGDASMSSMGGSQAARIVMNESAWIRIGSPEHVAIVVEPR